MYISIRRLDNYIAHLHDTEAQQKNEFQNDFIKFKRSSVGKTSGNCTNEPQKCVASLFLYHRLLKVNKYSR
jgi:hypothetical protein